MKPLPKDRIRVGKSSAGLGLFAVKDIPRFQKVVEYIGEHISHDEADRRGGKYLFTLSKDTIIDGKDRQNIARYVNHGCKPNCYAEIDEDKGKIFYIAKRKINAGEEITINYGKEYFEDHIQPYGCRCVTCQEKAT